MAKQVVTLEEQDVLELQMILIDRDEKAALDFLENSIAAKLPRKGSSPCDSTRHDPYLLMPESDNKSAAST